MSDRTHQYRQLSRRDPATTAQIYGTDPSTGEAVPLQTSDGKLVVEVSGGGGGGASTVLIQGKDGTVQRDVKVDAQGRIVIEKTAIEAKFGSLQIPLAADGTGALIVAPKADSTVLLRAKNGAVTQDVTKSNFGLDVHVKASTELPVSINSSITVPVEVQGVAEVKATSANWWTIGRGLGPVIVPGLSDSEGWIDVRPFSRISATGIGQTYTYDLAEGFAYFDTATVHTVTDWASLTAAITAAASGDVIFLRNGEYTMPSATALAVNKPLTLIGESREGVFIQTMTTVTAGLNAIIAITSDDVTIASLTVRWQHLPASPSVQSSITVAPASAGAHYSRIRLENLRIQYVEMGITAKIADSRIASCAIVYTGAAGNGHRGMYIRSVAGENEIIDNTYDAGASNDMRFIHLTHDTGGSATGRLSVCRNTQTSPLSYQFFELSTINGIANGFDLVVSDNYSRETNAFVIFSGLTAGRIDYVNSVTIARNDIANGTEDGPSSLTGKGLLGFDAGAGGTVVIRATPLPIYEDGNEILHTGLRYDSPTSFYESIYSAELVAARGTSGFTVAASSAIPAETYPAETGDNVLIYADTTVALEYRVTRDEPYTAEIAAHRLHQAHKHIVPPLEPQDILGVGFVRFNATDLHTDPGGSFAIFGVAK
jgi:hypothetical protein